MKKYNYCGNQYPDEATHCAIDAQPLTPITSPGVLPKNEGQATASLILGILSVACLGLFAGIPAVILGHLARNKARLAPDRFGGTGMALAGLIMGYVGTALSLVWLLILPAMLLPALTRAKERAQSINCINNMKQIGLAYRTWALEHEDQYPSNLSTNKGGTMELAFESSGGFDGNGVFQFQVLSNELATPKVLVCPADNSKQAVLNFSALRPGNVSYRVRYGTNLNDSMPQEVLAVCLVHGHTLQCDGSVQNKSRSSLRRAR